MLGRIQRRLRYWLHSGERARLLREEIEIHLEMMAQELKDGGMPEAEARYSARRRFGSVTSKQEESREIWIARWLSDFLQDASFAARMLRKQPGFAAIAIFSAALGIGACSLIFAIANFALYRPLPVSEPSRVMSVTARNLTRGKIGQTISYPDFEDLRQAHSFQAMTAIFQFMPAIISSSGEPRRYWGSVVTANYFDVVRPAFALGRGFDAARDDLSGEPAVIVLSHQLWLARFNGDHGIIGRVIELNNRKVTVLGVAGPGFRGTEAMFYSDFWLPFSTFESLVESAGISGDRFYDRGGQWLLAAARLREGVSEEEAATEIELIANRLKAAYPATNKTRGFHIERAGQVNPGVRKMIVLGFLLLLGAAALVLCTSCANVANLLLARAASRQREIAIRIAIGAGRMRLVRQLLTESLFLALLGGTAGYAVARLGVAAIGMYRIPLALPVDLSVSLDYRVLLFCIALSGFTGVLFGLAPALRATQPDLVSELKSERVYAGGVRRLGMRNLLVVAQVAICMVLLIGSSLFLRSLRSAYNIDPGFTHRSLLMLAFDPSLNRYSATKTRQIVDAILEKTGAIPGVDSACLTDSVPLSMEGTQNGFVPDDKISDKKNNVISANVYAISTRFFETFGIRMLEGEDFSPGMPPEDVVIVNQALAETAFPNQNPIGRGIFYSGKMCRIIGLAATIKSRSIGEDPRPSLYLPIAQNLRGNDSLTGITLVLRTRGEPAGYAPLVRQTIREIDPTIALFDVRTMEAQLSLALFLPRAAALLFGFAGIMGLLVATIGLYGVISFSVARRTKEIGLRMALGARRPQILGMVLKRGIFLAATGSAVGLGFALFLSRIIASLLYGVSPTDIPTFVGVPLLLLLIALLACLVPARRAASLDPNCTLRCE